MKPAVETKKKLHTFFFSLRCRRTQLEKLRNPKNDDDAPPLPPRHGLRPRAVAGARFGGSLRRGGWSRRLGSCFRSIGAQTLPTAEDDDGAAAGAREARRRLRLRLALGCCCCIRPGSRARGAADWQKAQVARVRRWRPRGARDGKGEKKERGERKKKSKIQLCFLSFFPFSSWFFPPRFPFCPLFTNQNARYKRHRAEAAPSKAPAAHTPPRKLAAKADAAAPPAAAPVVDVPVPVSKPSSFPSPSAASAPSPSATSPHREQGSWWDFFCLYYPQYCDAFPPPPPPPPRPTPRPSPRPTTPPPTTKPPPPPPQTTTPPQTTQPPPPPPPPPQTTQPPPPPPTTQPPSSPPPPPPPPQTTAPPSPPPPSSDEALLLKLHNDLRAKHAAAPLTWDSARLEPFARNWSSGCVFAHSSGSGFGENLALGYSSWTEAFDAWAAECSKVDFSNPSWSSETGHCTQLLWKGTKSLGCAKVLGRAREREGGESVLFFEGATKKLREKNSLTFLFSLPQKKKKKKTDKLPRPRRDLLLVQLLPCWERPGLLRSKHLVKVK